MLRSVRPLALLVLALFVVAGCGSAPKPADSPAPSTPASTPAKAEPAAEKPRSIKHTMGTTEITGTPKRVVALEWTYAENLLALGVQPVGVADVANYKKWVNVKPDLAADVADVGTRQEPNLETIASLKPDLIIAVGFRHKAIYDKLKAIAPTLVFEPYPPEGGVNQYQEMEETFLAMAGALNRTEQGKAVLKRMHDKFAQAAETLKKANKSGEFVLSQAYSSKDAAVIRLFTDNSMASQILTRIGLKNAFKSDKFQIYGFATVTVEGLVAVEKAHFLYVVQDTDNVFAKQLKDNPVWKNLSFVKEKRTYSLGGATWLFGGPLSAEVFVDRAVELLTK